MFIQTEATPNPDTLKFLPGREVSPGTPFQFDSLDDSAPSPLAKALFQLKNVSSVFLGADYVAVSKTEAADWAVLKPQVLAAIMDHFMSGLPVVEDSAQGGSSHDDDETVYEGEAAEIVTEIKELLETRGRPAVAADGGDIVFRRFEKSSGIVTLTMRGACAGCPSSTMTLKNGIENLLRHYIPEVTAVEATE